MTKDDEVFKEKATVDAEQKVRQLKVATFEGTFRSEFESIRLYLSKFSY